MNKQRYKPSELLQKYRDLVGGISNEEFFRRPKHKKTQELWCAVHFSLAYDRYINPCAVLISDDDAQTDADFELECGGETLPFQITEVTDPGRRRGDEYRNGATPSPQSNNWTSGTEQGPSLVRSAIEKKVSKRYASAHQLNLLCYLNFGAWSQQFEDIRTLCEDVSSKFASVWLLNGNAMCCIHPLRPELLGWLQIPETLKRCDA